MADWDDILRSVDEKKEDIDKDLEIFKGQVEAKIEAAKRDEILSELKKTNARLDAIEKRLPPEDPEESSTVIKARH